MKKINNLIAVVLLLVNIVLQPIISIQKVFAEEASSEVVTEISVEDTETVVPTPEPIIEENPEPPVPVEETPTEPPSQEEMSTEVEDTPIETDEKTESLEEDTTSSEVVSTDSESETLKEAVTLISLNNGNQTTTGLRSGSLAKFAFTVSNSQAELTDAIVRVTVPSTYVERFTTSSEYFPGQNIGSQTAAYDQSGNLIIDFKAGTLSEEYNRNFEFNFKAIDNGSMKNGQQIPVKAEVIQNSKTITTTSIVNYQFVTRQPIFRTNVTYPAEASEDDDEDAHQQTEVLFSFSFGDEGVGNGSGRSTVNTIAVTADIPETLTFDSSLNEGWSYEEGSRTASYSFTPDASIYDAAYSMPTSLSLLATNNNKGIQESIYAEATFSFANGDVVTKSNQAEVAMMAVMEIAPMAALDGNYVSGFDLILVDINGEEINIPNGETVIDPTIINHMNLSYHFAFPAEMNINANDTYEITLPSLVNISPRTDSIQSENGPLVNYEVTEDGRVIFTFTDDWNIDTRLMHLDMQTNINAQLFEEQREVEVNVPYVDGNGFNAVLVGSKDGVEGADIKTGNTFNAANEPTDFRPEYAKWTIRVNDTLKSYENASVIDTLSLGHTLDSTSLEVYRIPRNYLTGAETGEPVFIDPSEYTSAFNESGFNLGFGIIQDTYEIRYRTKIDYETVESQTTINNTARIILDGTENKLERPIDLEWGNDFDPIVKSGSVDTNDITKVNWEVKYNFSSHSLGDVRLTDLIDIGTVDLSTVEVFEVGVDGNGNPTGWNMVEEESTINDDGNAVINIPDSNGKAYVIRFTSDVPGNYVGLVTNTIDDNNPSTRPGEAGVEVNTSPGGDKTGLVKYGEDGAPYIEWKVQFNTNRVVYDNFSFTDTFDVAFLELDQASFVLTHSGNKTLEQGSDFTVSPSASGFDFKLVGESEKEVYTLTYRTNYTADGLKQDNVSNAVDWGWNGDVGPTAPVDHPVAGINKTGNYVTGTVEGDGGVVTKRQEIAWKIEFNTNHLVLEKPKLFDTLTPAELEIIAGTFTIKTGETPLVEGTDYTFTPTTDGFEVHFINDSLPATYVVEYRTTIPAENLVSSINTAQLEWQGNVERDTAEVDLGINKPGANKNGKTVAYEEDGETLKKNEWDIRFNTNKRIIQDLVLTDTYTPGVIVDAVVITDVDNTVDLSEGTDYTVDLNDGQFVVTFLNQTEPVEYSLKYSTSYNESDDRVDAVNSYKIDFKGGTEDGSKTIAKPKLNLQKASTNVTGIVVNEDSTVKPAVISWEVKGNTDGPNYVYLKNAVFEDTIQSDQRFVEGSMMLNGDPVTPTWTGTPEGNDYRFTVPLPDGAAEHVLTFETEIYSYPSNATRNNQSEYHNRVELVNFKGVEGKEETQGYNAYAQYFKDSSKQNPSKTGVQDPADDLIKWEAIVNADALPIKNAHIRDIVDENLEHVGFPEVYAVINGVDVLVPTEGYAYAQMDVDGKPAFTITFNGPTTVTPNEVANGMHYTYKLKYDTSLREAVIGTKTVSNMIQVIGHEKGTVIETITNSTYSEKWYFGGGGSSRTLTMKFRKVDADNNDILLEGVTFEIFRVTGSDNTETKTIDFSTLADGYKELATQRAGRYILREKTTLPNYIVGDDIYFIIGYDADGNTVLDITDNNFSNLARLDSDLLTIENERQKTNITANKIWEGESSNHPTVWFKLYRQIGEEGTPEAAPEEIKELEPGVTQVSWAGVDDLNSEGLEYVYTVQEVDAEGNESTPIGYTKAEEGLTVTNTESPIEINVTKVWDDADNQDGIRPESIEVQLTANGTPSGQPIELNSTNDWSGVFMELPAYIEGTLIEYSVVETKDFDGYEVSVNNENQQNIIVTNIHTPATTELSANKVWDDGNNQDGLRPESVEVQLMAGEDVLGDPVVLDVTNAWTHTWTDLPANASGEPIVYSVIESNVPEAYEVTIGENVEGVITITNTHTPAVVNIPVSKVWDDADDQDGVRPATITANLLADGNPVGEIELSVDNEWAHTFESLPVYNEGSIIKYTVTEDTVEDYSTLIEGTVVEGFVITNSYTPDETSVTVTKNWQDGNNQDGNRLESIEVQLTADGVATDHTAVLNEENDWTATWSGLALNSDGTAVDYSVEEITVVDGYEVVVDAEDHGNIILTNTYEPAVTDLTVNKVWDDAENQDGIQPESVEVQLIAGNQENGDPVTLNADNNWSYTWTDLAVNAAGEAIEYSIVEVNVPEGYTSTVSEIIEGTITVANIHEPEVTSIKVSKAWNDADNQDGIRPESITVELKANGDIVAEPVELNADNSWTHTWSDLAVNATGEAIEYEVIESGIPAGYEVGINSENPEEVVITNTHIPAVTELTVNKVWDDGNNQDGLRPASVEVQLMAGEDVLGDPVVLDGTNAWTHSWTELPVNVSGSPIVYTVEETEVPAGYEATQEVVDGIVKITNTHTPAVVNIPVSKVWDDADDQDGVRPETITANLLADGNPVGKIELSVDNEWAHTFESLPVYNEGSIIKYTVTEDTVEDYSTLIEGFVITNSYTPDETSVTVTKNWQDGNNQDGNRLESIEVQLTADGVATDHTAVLNEENDWTATWSGLALNSDGVAIDYSVIETTIPEGYEVSIDDENHGNIIVTNSYSPELVEVSGNKIWEDNDNNANNRPEVITVNLLANNVVVESQEVSSDEEGNWSYKFSGLPVYEAGQTIDYTITEDEVSYYDTEIEGYDIVNTYNPPKVSVGDYVWIDVNKDGLQDNTDIPLSGVVLTIVDKDGNPVTDVFGNLVGPQITDENGHYSFDNLPIDKTYTVTIDRKASEKVLEGLEPTLEEEGENNGIDSSTWQATSRHLTKDEERDPTLDFGFSRVKEVLPSVSVGDYVWIDENKDGLQDATDIPLAGIVLTVVDEKGNPVTDVFGNPVVAQTTDSNGYYTFDNLPIDHTYTVRINREASAEALKGLEPTLENIGNREGDSSTWEATSVEMTKDGQRDPTLDFGFIRTEPGKGSVGDYVWIDRNKDGLQDETDEPLADVILTIEDENGKQVKDVYGNQVGSVTTDENGYYRFDNLPLDKKYIVRINREAFESKYPELVPTIEGAGTRDNDSSLWVATSVILTEDGQHDPTLDFGFVIKVTGVVDPKNPGKSGKTLPNTGEESWMIYAIMTLTLGAALVLFGRKREKK